MSSVGHVGSSPGTDTAKSKNVISAERERDDLRLLQAAYGDDARWYVVALK